MNKWEKLVFAAVAFCAAALYADLPDPMVWFDVNKAANGKVPDASGNGCDLTLSPSVEIVDAGFLGKVLKVTGQTSDYATFSCPVVTNTTIAFWYYHAKTEGSIPDKDGKEQNSIPYLLNTGYSGFGINYGRSASTLALIDQVNKPNQHNFSGPDAGREQWHHVVFTVEYEDDGAFGKLTGKAYLDGGLKKTTVNTNTSAMKPAGTCKDIVMLNNAVNGVRPMSGMLADIRFYDVALDAAQVRELAKGGLAGNRLVLRYAFDEVSEAVDGNGRHTTPDAVGFGSTMTLGKNMTLVDDGVEGKAVRFMSTTEVGAQVVAPPIPLEERTLSVWIRSSIRRREMNAILKNPYPRLIDGLTTSNGGYGQFSGSDTLGRYFSFMPAGCGTAGKAATSYAIVDHEVWGHLAIVEHCDAEGNGLSEIYVNGKKISDSGFPKSYAFQTLPGSISFFLGNCNSFSGDRYFCGDMDEFRLYNYALSDDEVRRLYSGLAKISAGDDFTVAGTKGLLHGTVAANAGDNFRKGYAGELTWTLVSAPAGGEGAEILQPASALTDVTLPVSGEYVFRLTISDLGVSKSDDVTVTCVAADAGNVAPTVSVVASKSAVTRPDPVTLTATVTDDDKPAPAKTRVRWAKVSGPDGVWFEPDDAAVTKVSFGAPGAYRLVCLASDGQAESAKEVEIVVSDPADGKNLSTDLLRYWSLDGQVYPHFTDPVYTGADSSTAPDYVKMRFLPGKVGNALRTYAYSGTGAYLDTGAPVGEEACDDPSYTSSIPPKNDYLTISAWIYIDPADTNLVNGRICGASVVGQSHTLGLRYNEKFGPTSAINEGGFTLFQQGLGGSTSAGSVGYSMVHYPAPNPSPVGRWMHICGILARTVSNSSLWEMWYDGVKQTASSTSGNNRGRTNTNKLLIGGMNYTGPGKNNDGSLNAGGSYNANWPIGTSLTECYSRTFPGLVDEVRIWKRKLTAEEIRYLAANPMIGENKGPSVEPAETDDAHPVARTATGVSAVAFADKLPAGGALTYEWSVVKGDAACVTFGTPSAATTTFTAMKKGEYVVQLKVSDGERAVYSKPLALTVEGRGMVLLLR